MDIQNAKDFWSLNALCNARGQEVWKMEQGGLGWQSDVCLSNNWFGCTGFVILFASLEMIPEALLCFAFHCYVALLCMLTDVFWV